MELQPDARPELEIVSPHSRVPHRRLTWRHASALARWARLKVRHRNLRGGLFFVDRGADIEIGPNTDICFEPGVRIMQEFRASFHEGRVRFGRNTFVSRGVYMSAVRGLDIGENCLIAEGVSIHDMDHDFGPHVADVPLPQRSLRAAPITIGNNVWIGSKATIVRGVNIGDDVVIAAHAVVTSDIPSHCVAAGIPARVMKSWALERSLRSCNEGGVTTDASAPGRGAESDAKGQPC